MSSKSNAFGFYHFEGVSAGVYTVKMAPSSSSQKVQPEFQTVIVFPGVVAKVSDFEVSTNGVEGLVTGLEGTPAVGV
jgi:hypothetical protein